MIRSAAKKKIEASATITNTMMVVIVVSRRVGQVTLAVSLRTSCRNLNGLKAIVCDRVRWPNIFSESEQPDCAQPSFEGEPQRGLDCPGMKKAAPEIRKTGRQQVALCTVVGRQGQGVSLAAKSRCQDRAEAKIRVG